jgi:hypothetical protein
MLCWKVILDSSVTNEVTFVYYSRLITPATDTRCRCTCSYVRWYHRPKPLWAIPSCPAFGWWQGISYVHLRDRMIQRVLIRRTYVESTYLSWAQKVSALCCGIKILIQLDVSNQLYYRLAWAVFFSHILWPDVGDMNCSVRYTLFTTAERNYLLY